MVIRRRLGSSILTFCVVLILFRSFFVHVTLTDSCQVLDKVNPIVANPLETRKIHIPVSQKHPIPRHLERVKTIFPRHKIILWSDEMLFGLVRDRYPEWAHVLEDLPKLIMRVDFSRLFVIHHFGGLILDADIEPIVDFWHRLPNDKVSLLQVRADDSGDFHISMMASPPRHPFWNKTWQLVARNDFYSKNLPQELVRTGSIMLTFATTEFPESVQTLPCNNYDQLQPFWRSPFRMFQILFGISLRNCGTRTCQLTIHHGTISWVEASHDAMEYAIILSVSITVWYLWNWIR